VLALFYIGILVKGAVSYRLLDHLEWSLGWGDDAATTEEWRRGWKEDE
jgi:hypothetical protein